MDEMNKREFDKVKYNKIYNKLNYKQLKANLKPDDYMMIDNYCKMSNISKAKFIVAACRYCIENNVKLFDE